MEAPASTKTSSPSSSSLPEAGKASTLAGPVFTRSGDFWTVETPGWKLVRRGGGDKDLGRAGEGICDAEGTAHAHFGEFGRVLPSPSRFV